MLPVSLMETKEKELDFKNRMHELNRKGVLWGYG
jgi:hypothetical protein